MKRVRPTGLEGAAPPPKMRIVATPRPKLQRSSLIFRRGNLTSFPSTEDFDPLFVEELGIDQNKLTEVPSLSKFKNLRILNAALNCFRALPDITGLRKLVELRFFNNLLTDISVLKDCDFPHLEVMALSFNRLKDINEHIGHFPNLSQVFLDNNYLVRFPRDLVPLQNLRHLALSFNQLSDLPDISPMTSLVELYLDHNDFSHFPTCISKLPYIEHISFSYNNLSDVPCDLGAMASLRELYLDNNCFRHVPAGVTALRNIIHLSFSYNRLVNVDGIGKLVSLRELFLDNNALVDLPEEMYLLSHLRTLSLVGNARMQRLPAPLLYMNIARLFFDSDPVNNPDGIYHARSECSISPSPPIPSLLHLAANSILAHNVPIDKWVPSELHELVRAGRRCAACENYFVTPFVVYEVASTSLRLQQFKLFHTILVDRNNHESHVVPVTLQLCVECDKVWQFR